MARSTAHGYCGLPGHSGCACSWTTAVEKSGTARQGEDTCVPLPWRLKEPQRCLASSFSRMTWAEVKDEFLQNPIIPNPAERTVLA